MTTTAPATGKQVSYLKTLARKVGRNATIGGETGPNARLDPGFARHLETIDRRQASALIDTFKKALGWDTAPKPRTNRPPARRHDPVPASRETLRRLSRQQADRVVDGKTGPDAVLLPAIERIIDGLTDQQVADGIAALKAKPAPPVICPRSGLRHGDSFQHEQDCQFC